MKKGIKRIIKLLVVCIIMLSFSMISYAEEGGWIDQTRIRTVDTAKEYVGNAEAKVVGTPRGVLISYVEVTLINLGNGVAQIDASTMCHEPMKTIKMVLFLEKWNEAEEEWDQEERFAYEWKAEDEDDGVLTYAMTSFNVYGLDRGYKYRVRGLFGAYDLDSGLQEAWQAWTADVYFD